MTTYEYAKIRFASKNEHVGRKEKRHEEFLVRPSSRSVGWIDVNGFGGILDETRRIFGNDPILYSCRTHDGSGSEFFGDTAYVRYLDMREL